MDEVFGPGKNQTDQYRWDGRFRQKVVAIIDGLTGPVVCGCFFVVYAESFQNRTTISTSNRNTQSPGKIVAMPTFRSLHACHLLKFMLPLIFVALASAQLTMAQDQDQESKTEPKEEWVQLFDGKSLTGWTPKITGYELGENFGDTFRVEDGILKVSYEKYDKFNGRFGHLFYEKEYSHYRLRVTYRFTGEQLAGNPGGWALRNSGLMLHGQPAKTMKKDQNFPISIEVQLLGGDGRNPRPTLNLCTPGTNVVMNDQLIRRHCTNSKSKTYHGDQWVTVEVEVRGNDVIKHVIDGQVVLEYNKPQLDDRDADAKELLKTRDKMLSKGSISIQSESHPVEFKKIELMVLDQSSD